MRRDVGIQRSILHSNDPGGHVQPEHKNTKAATANQYRHTTSIHQTHNLEAFVNHNAFGPVALVLDGVA